MLGQRLQGPVAVSDLGLDGDRKLSLIDVATGSIVSAKRPARWREVLQLGAHLTGDEVVVTLADGHEVRADDPDLNELLSTLLGRPVVLSSTPTSDHLIERAVPDAVLEHGLGDEVEVTTAPTGRDTGGRTFHDFAAVHLITTASLARVSGPIEGDPLEVVRYRPNLVISTEMDVTAERDWPGLRLRVGTAEFEIIVPSPRCAVPMLRHGTLPERRDAFSAIKRNGMTPVANLGELPCLGVYARVAVAGTIAPGDEAVLHT